MSLRLFSGRKRTNPYSQSSAVASTLPLGSRTSSVASAGRRVAAYRPRYGIKPRLAWPKPSSQAPFNTTLVTLRLTDAVTATAGGVINATTLLSNVTATPDWASYATIYDGFIVHGMSVTLLPQVPGLDTRDGGRGSLVSLLDMDSSSPATTIIQAFNYTSSKNHLALHGGSRMLWIPPERRTTINQMAVGFSAQNPDSVIQFIGEGYTPNTAFFYRFVKFFVEFRNSR